MAKIKRLKKSITTGGTTVKEIDAKIQQLAEIPGLYQFILDNCFVAGGAVRDIARNVKPKDWDIFFRTEEAKDEFIVRFGKYCTKTGIGNFNYQDFQFITLYTGTPEEVIGQFDWNVNQRYYEFGTSDKSYYKYPSSSQPLRFNCKARKPLSAYLRLPDMLAKGYTIEQEELMFLLSFLAQTAPVRGGCDLSNEFEFMSSGGGYIGASKAEKAIERASEEAKKQSPLYKLL